MSIPNGVPTPQDMLRHGRVKLLLANTLTLDAMLAEQGMRAEQLQEQFDLIPSDSYIAFSCQTDPRSGCTLAAGIAVDASGWQPGATLSALVSGC